MQLPDDDAPPKVLYFLNALDRGGAELGLVRLIRGGVFDGCELKIVTIAQGRGELASELKALGFPATSLIPRTKMRIGAIPFSMLEFRRLLKAYAPDILILSLPQANIIGRICGAIERTPMIVSFEHNTRLSNPVYEILFRATSGVVTWMFADCASTADIAGSRFYRQLPPMRSVVPLVAFSQSARPQPRTRAAGEPFHVISAGRFTCVKNQDALIRAVARLCVKGRNIKLTLFGDGPRRAAYQRLVRSLGLSSRVCLPGFVRDWHRAAADLFVVSSRHEGQCLVALEAMHAGIPVLAPRAGGLAELADLGALVALADVGPEAIGGEIDRIIDAPDSTARYVRRAAQIIDEHYSRDATAFAYATLNRALITACRCYRPARSVVEAAPMKGDPLRPMSPKNFLCR